MKLDDLYKDRLTSYCYAERYINNGSPSGLSVNSTSFETSPTGTNKHFLLPSIKVPPGIDVISRGDKNHDILLENEIFVHPDMLEEESIAAAISTFNKSVKRKIRVSPTASARTLKIFEQESGFIKLSYHKLLGRFIREMHDEHITAGLEISHIFRSLIEEEKVSQAFSFLPEVFGKSVRLPAALGGEIEWGYLLREGSPYPPASFDEILLPVFSLFSDNGEEPPLLVQIFERQTSDINSFLLNDLIFPICRVYWDALIGGGIALEAHAQNLLVTLDSSQRVRRIVIRDLESADRDLDLMTELCLPWSVSMQPGKCLSKSDYNYIEKHSFMFDFKLGEYVLTPILECADKFVGIDSDHVLGEIKSFNQSFIKRLPKGYFPEGWFSYESRVFEPNTKRQYISHPLTKYR